MYGTHDRKGPEVGLDELKSLDELFKDSDWDSPEAESAGAGKGEEEFVDFSELEETLLAQEFHLEQEAPAPEMTAASSEADLEDLFADLLSDDTPDREEIRFSPPTPAETPAQEPLFDLDEHDALEDLFADAPEAAAIAPPAVPQLKVDVPQDEEALQLFEEIELEEETSLQNLFGDSEEVAIADTDFADTDIDDIADFADTDIDDIADTDFADTADTDINDLVGSDLDEADFGDLLEVEGSDEEMALVAEATGIEAEETNWFDAIADEESEPAAVTDGAAAEGNLWADLFQENEAIAAPTAMESLFADTEAVFADTEMAGFDLTPDAASEAALGFDDLFGEDMGEVQAPPPTRAAQPPALSVQPLTPSPQPAIEGVFTELEALLGSKAIASPKPYDPALVELDLLLGVQPVLPSVPVESAVPQFEDFADLEELMRAEMGSGSAPVPRGLAGSESPTRRRADQTMRVSIRQLDNLSNLIGELVVNRNSLEDNQERLRQFLDNLLHQVQQMADVGQRMQDLYERELLKAALLANRSGHIAGRHHQQSSDSVTVGAFTALEMDTGFTGFHILAQEIMELIVRVRESSSDIVFLVESTEQVTRQLRQVTTKLQEGLTRSRMVPFSEAADRLPRGVRDNSIKFGKKVELAVEGKETLIDKMILEQLRDPLNHLVNNAIAHGIESPEERDRRHKAPTGRITVRAFHQGNQTVISVSDDGGGIDPMKVKAKALQKRLITETEAAEMSKLDVFDLLFLPGFSTRDKADDLAGRGVGMDVVRTRISELRGAVTIDSTMGQGTTFTLRLPLTLSISRALCCISDRARIAFPLDGVEDTIDMPTSEIKTDDEGETYILWRDKQIPFKTLSELLKYNRYIGRGRVYGSQIEENAVPVVILRSTNTYLALQVDQVQGEQEIVIKQLEGPVPKPMGIAGATITGDGRILAIADVLELIDLSLGRRRREAASSLWEEAETVPPVPEEEEQSEPTVLIVDDSITVRELLSMTFKKAGYRVEQARDGQEGWEKLRSGLPCDMVFCDIEMPRMNGIEVLSQMQKDPHLCRIPVAMLTSRSADKYQRLAAQLGAKGYFTKPYLEDNILESAQRMLKGENLLADKASGAPVSQS